MPGCAGYYLLDLKRTERYCRAFEEEHFEKAWPGIKLCGRGQELPLTGVDTYYELWSSYSYGLDPY